MCVLISSSGFSRIVGAPRNLRGSLVSSSWDHDQAAGDSRGSHERHHCGAGGFGCPSTARQVTRLKNDLQSPFKVYKRDWVLLNIKRFICG